MAEQMTEEQILDSFEKNSFGASEATEEVPAQKATPETQPDAENAQVEGADAEVTQEPSEKEEETQTIEIDPDEALFEQQIDDGGKKVTQKLSLKELQQGYLRQSDYTKKTQELAKQRAEAQEQVRQATQVSVKQYSERLDQLQAALVKTVAPELANVDWNKLATEDAFEYVRLSNRARQVNDVLQAIQAEKTQTSNSLKEQEEKAKSETWAKSVEILQRDIPDWGEPVAKRLAKAAQDAGFTNDEVAQWNDHRLIKLAHKAGLYDELNSKQATADSIVKKKIALVPKVLKPGPKANAGTPVAEAMKRLQKSGKPEDALPFFEALVR
ncbi:MAG TPA: hypothetical protein VLM19_05245 [Nitrospiraceae bacterium]|nr:hypothetical protein [Nitrospiraceae bacterium]